MTKDESISINPEMTPATEEFVAKIYKLAPEVWEGRTVKFEEFSHINKGGNDHRFHCNISPAKDPTLPPSIALFHGPSPIWHAKDIFTFDKGTRSYWKKHVDVEPGLYETTEPDEYHTEPVEATTIELGRVLGVLEFLERKTEQLTPGANRGAAHRTLGQRIVSYFS